MKTKSKSQKLRDLRTAACYTGRTYYVSQVCQRLDTDRAALLNLIRVLNCTENLGCRRKRNTIYFDCRGRMKK